MRAIPAQTEFVRRMTRVEAIEIAAQAIRTVAANRSGRGRPWNELPEKLRQDYRAEAEAALRAVGIIP